jgi:L-histidine Nalpha-methyltransferase
MEIEYRILKLEEIPQTPLGLFALDILEGLSGNPKRIPSACLYDKIGSELFQRITGLEDYYLTKCESEILSLCRDDLARCIPPGPFNLIELGAGDGQKTVLLIEHFLRMGFEFEYFPLDVSAEAVNELVCSLRGKTAGGRLRVNGIISEYFDGLKWLSGMKGSMNVVLFLGSNIGNFDAASARRFLRHLWYCLRPGDLVFIGFDLKKDIELLNRAYNDPEGITREFNLNLLDRINRELGADFDRKKFTFYSHYSVSSGAVESFLVSQAKQKVLVKKLEKVFYFEKWEGIQSESSHKFLDSEITSLAAETGFVVARQFFDSRGYFVDSLWRVDKRV